jgi:hypothetical protein
VHGTRAGNLVAGSIIGGDYALKRGQSFMIGLDFITNVGSHQILVQSVEPQSTSSNLRPTAGRIWIVPRHAHLTLPNSWPGWPPKHPPTKPAKSDPKSWLQPHPNVLTLPTSRTIPPGRQAQLVYGISLDAAPSAGTSITALRIHFKQDGHSYVWTLPEPVHLSQPHQ